VPQNILHGGEHPLWQQTSSVAVNILYSGEHPLWRRTSFMAANILHGGEHPSFGGKHPPIHSAGYILARLHALRGT